MGIIYRGRYSTFGNYLQGEIFHIRELSTRGDILNEGIIYSGDNSNEGNIYKGRYSRKWKYRMGRYSTFGKYRFNKVFYAG